MNKAEKQSLVLVRMQTMYSYMLSQAKTVDAREYFRFGVPLEVETATIWKGYIREISEALETPKYLIDQALGRLKSLECVRQISQGAAGNPSIYLLIEPPTLENYEALQERSSVTGRFKPATPQQRMQDSINRLTNRVAELEQRMERLELVQKSHALRTSGG